MASVWLYIAVAILAFVIYGFRPTWQWRVRHIPGPYPTWMLGSMLQLRAKGSHVYHAELSKKYGPIFKTYGLGRPVIVVTDPKLTRDVLLHNHNRPMFGVIDQSNPKSAEFEKASILSARGDKWKSLRSAWSPMFFTGSLEACAGLMNDSAATLAQRLGRAAEGGQAIDIWRFLGDMTMEVVGTAAFGVNLHTQTSDPHLQGKEAGRAQQLRADVAAIFRGFGGIASKYFLLLVLFPEAGWLIRKISTRFPDSKQLPLRQARNRLIDVTSNLVAQHRANLQRQAEASAALPNGNHGSKPQAEAGGKPQSKVSSLTATPGSAADLRKGVQPGSFIDLLVRGVDRTTEQGFTDIELANQAFTMILAGYETTANTLAFAIYNLAKSPDKVARLCAEVDAHPGNPDYQSLDKLAYTDAVLRESLRLFPPGAIGVREASKDQIIGGYKIRKGQMLMSSFWALHRDEKVWQDAEAFLPERWLDSSPKAVEQRNASWKAFGDGPRGCPGWRFAIEEAKIALHHIFRAYTFRLAPGQEPLALSNTITLSPKHGIQVTVHRRR